LDRNVELKPSGKPSLKIGKDESVPKMSADTRCNLGGFEKRRKEGGNRKPQRQPSPCISLKRRRKKGAEGISRGPRVPRKGIQKKKGSNVSLLHWGVVV